MTEKEYQDLRKIFSPERTRGLTKEEAVRHLKKIGVLDEQGNLTEDYQCLPYYFDSIDSPRVSDSFKD